MIAQSARSENPATTLRTRPRLFRLAMVRLLPRFARRSLSDAHALLAIALAVTVLVAEIPAGTSELGRVTLLAAVYLGLELVLATKSPRVARSYLPLARLALALGFITAIGLLEGGINARPTGTLYISVVTMAAATGGREALAIGAAALALYIVPRIVDPVASQVLLERTTVLSGMAIFLAIGTRLTVTSLEHARDRARRAMSEDRRRGRQLLGVEAVGRLLAKSGATPDALEEVMEVLDRRFGYRYPSIYLREGDTLRLGAYRNYSEPITEIPVDVGVVGRVARTGEPALVTETRTDPDYVSASSAIESEVSVPVTIGTEVVGVLNVESTAAHPLDDSDVASLTLVADRVASALELARERESLARRAELFERLTTVSARLAGSLEPDAAFKAIAQSIGDVVATDFVIVVVLDPLTGEYRIAADVGGTERIHGLRIQPGEGMSGRAIAERRVIVDEHFDRSRFPIGLRDAEVEEVVAAAVPLIYDDEVVGAISLGRVDIASRFSDLELEVLPVLAAQAAVTIRNAHLMTTIREASVRDPLTGLYNRRHFDASVERLIAARRRMDSDERRPVSAILFDLDHFGALNKRHGHAVGDAVLRAFATMLRDRFRASDIVARFGGEEFVVILDGATRDEAVSIADSVRATLAEAVIDAQGGVSVRATVSAGCAALSEESTNAAALLEVADVGLVMAKQAGRNQVVAA